MVQKEPDPIYVRMGYENSVSSKKDLLSSEISFLNLIKIIRRYGLLRQEEFAIKLKMAKKIHAIDASLRKTKAAFPFLKIPQSAKREEVVARKNVVTISKESFDRDLENQLRDIQQRLKSIGR